MIIDIHTHLPYHKIFPESFMENIAVELVGQDQQKQAFIKKLIRANLNDHDGKALCNQMDESNISKSILLIADFGYSMGEAALSIEEIHELHRDVQKICTDRFIVFGGVDPRRGRPAVDYFEKSIVDFGFKGLKLYPPCGFELDAPELYPLYEICQKHNLPILSHTGPSFPVLTTERRYPQSIMKVSEEFPGVNFIMGHGGAKAWKSNVAVARKRKNVFLDISTFQTTVSQEEELEERFRYFFDQVPDQVLFGSDWPMFALGSSLKKITDLILRLSTIKDDEREKLLYRNAKILLNI